MTFHSRKGWICDSRCQVRDLRDFFALKLFRDYSLCSVCILPPVCSPHSAFCTQPAFYPQSAVCILHWPNISDNPVMVASSVTPTIYGLTQYTRIFYWVLLPGLRKTDYLGYFKSCFHQLWLSKAVARRKNCRNPNALNLCSEMAEA